MEKRLAPGQYTTKHRVPIIAPLQYRMEQKGQQVEAEHKRRQILLAMTKVVLQMRALGLEHVIVFVFDLPAPPTRLGYRHHGVGCQAMIGDTAIVIEWFTRCGINDRDLEPIDRQGIVTPAQEYLVEVAHHRYFRETPIPAVLFTDGHSVVGLPKRDALIDFGMRVGFARKNEVAPLLDHQRTHGLVAVEIVAQEGHAMRRYLGGMFTQPAFARGAFTVLFDMAILRHDVLRGERNALRLSRADDHRGDSGMIVEGLAIGALPGETVLAMNSFGRNVVGAV